MTVNLSDALVRLLLFHLSCLTRLSEDVWVGYCHSGGEVVPSVLRFELPRDKLGLLSLKLISRSNIKLMQQTAFIFCD